MSGPLSGISSNYSRFSRGLIIEFVKQHHYANDLARHVHPRNRFDIKQDQGDSEALIAASGEDLKKLDRLIADIEPKESSVPVLLKKYLLLNARIIGFNSDPRFNDALDDVSDYRNVYGCVMTATGTEVDKLVYEVSGYATDMVSGNRLSCKEMDGVPWNTMLKRVDYTTTAEGTGMNSISGTYYMPVLGEGR